MRKIHVSMFWPRKGVVSESMSLITRLKESFIKEGVSINAPASALELNAFERKYSVKLPAILRDYFLEFNGTGQGNFGDDGFAFFSLSEFKLASEELNRNEPDKLFYPNCYVFSDYLLWCWGYGVQLSNDGSDGPVFVITGSPQPPRQVADSFSKFIWLYMKNSDVLL